MPGVSNSLEVLVFGLLGPGSRGRPCVTKDVTEVLQQESLKMLAAFVGILDDQAVQESLPGEALHEMAENLMFPLLQVWPVPLSLVWHFTSDNTHALASKERVFRSNLHVSTVRLMHCQLCCGRSACLGSPSPVLCRGTMQSRRFRHGTTWKVTKAW